MNDIEKIDFHIHSTVSDGTDTPTELLSRVKENGLSIFSLTDHDAVKGCKIISSELKNSESPPVFITGVEFSCKDEKGKYHILGYGYDTDGESINSVVEKGHNLRMEKVRSRLDFIEKEYGFTFEKEEIRRLLSMDNPGKPHIANLMLKHTYAKTKEQAITDYLDKLHISDGYIRPEEAIEGIVNSGGIPVLAHPYFGNGDQLILGEEMEERLKHLINYGLKGVEAYYSGFSKRLISEMLKLADKLGLYVTAGSDYHGKNKIIRLGDTGLNPGEPVPEKIREFIERVT